MTTVSDAVLDRLNTAPPEEKTRTGELGQEEFLSLMLAQIQNQDPFEPMENGEFIAQMAQFATVDGIEDMRTSIANLNDTMTSSQAVTASTLVGRGVLAPADTVQFDGTTPVTVSILADPGASRLTLDVLDAAGALVARREVTPAPGGTTRIEWDGRASNGAALPAGAYRLQAQAGSNGEFVAVDTAVEKRIDSVTIGSSISDLQLNLNDGRSMKFSDARELL